MTYMVFFGLHMAIGVFGVPVKFLPLLTSRVT